MLVSKLSAMHQLRRRSAQKPQLDLIADRMPLACIGHKSLEICDRCRLWQRNSPATPENSAAFWRREFRNSLFRCKPATVTFVSRRHPALPEDPHHQKCRIELQGPFFESTDGQRNYACSLAFLDRIEQILPVFDPAWINAHLLA
jgi:hypothetical protein